MNQENRHIVQTILLAIGVVVVPFCLAKAALYVMQLIQAAK